jgi:heme-degrading monooxygenase HmoA
MEVSVAVVYMTYPVHRGKEMAFQEAYAMIFDVMRAAEGHKESHLFRRISEPGAFLIVSEWENKSAFDTFVNSEQFKLHTTEWGKNNIVSGPPSHHIVET